jgi:hypothetical protein
MFKNGKRLLRYAVFAFLLAGGNCFAESIVPQNLSQFWVRDDGYVYQLEIEGNKMSIYCSPQAKITYYKDSSLQKGILNIYEGDNKHIFAEGSWQFGKTANNRMPMSVNINRGRVVIQQTPQQPMQQFENMRLRLHTISRTLLEGEIQFVRVTAGGMGGVSRENMILKCFWIPINMVTARQIQNSGAPMTKEGVAELRRKAEQDEKQAALLAAENLQNDLIDAVIRGDQEAAKRFLDQGASTTVTTKKYPLPLIEYSLTPQKNEKMFAFLVDNGCKVESKNVCQFVSQGERVLLETCVSRSKPTNGEKQGWLLTAVDSKQPEVVRFLLSMNADPNVFSNGGACYSGSGKPADLARSKGYKDISALFGVETAAPAPSPKSRKGSKVGNTIAKP